MDILYNMRLNGIVHIPIEDGSFSCYAVYFDKLRVTALYSTTEVDLRYESRSTILRYSRIQYGPDLFPYGLASSLDILRNTFYVTRSSIVASRHARKEKKNLPIIRSWIEGNIDPPVAKISAQHLRHISIKELRKLGWQWVSEGIEYILPCLERLANVGMNEALFVGLILWAKTLTGQSAAYSKVSGIWNWKFSSVDDFIQQVKTRFSLRLKALQNLVDMDLRAFFELEVLANRGIGAVDWEQERNNRERPNTVTFPPEHIYGEAFRIFSKVRGTRSEPRKTNWDDYWKARWEWAPTGSAHSQYAEDSVFRANDVFNRHKLHTLCSMPRLKLQYFTDRVPEICAWKSTKCEWTKMRAIYGVDITNFILSGFVMGDCEEVLSSTFPIGKSANENEVRSRVKEVLKNGVPFCFDFEDFNSQHTIESMKAVLSAYRDVFSTSLSEQQLTAMDWIISSVNNCFVMSDSEKEYRVNGTLLSGWRLTTFMNTVLNKVYTQLMMDGDDLVSIHNGDDILAAVTSIKQVQNLTRGASKYNVRFQTQKCFLGATAEFLRIDHTNEGNGQYLARSIATLVHGPTEMAVPNNLLAIISAIDTRMKEAVSRGANPQVLEEVFAVQSEYLTEKWGTTAEEMLIIRNTHLSKGGLSTIISKETLSHTVSTKVINSMEKKKTVLEDEKNHYPGAYDYADILTKDIVPRGYFYNIMEGAKKTILSLSQSRRFGCSVKECETDGTDFIKASKYGMYRGIVSSGKLSLAKAFNIPILAIKHDSKKVMDIISSEKDVMEALRILF
uniref:RNA-directed RNA polymerase n=1 Tax=Erysiphales associated totivirus 6 TaxID=2719858 RepID=A0A6G9ELJ3_9VIRU|nr:RNA-dependent RNA polymerase [Erysiphales associated totivirus 6]